MEAQRKNQILSEAKDLFLLDKQKGTVEYKRWEDVPEAEKERYLSEAEIVVENDLYYRQ